VKPEAVITIASRKGSVRWLKSGRIEELSIDLIGNVYAHFGNEKRFLKLHADYYWEEVTSIQAESSQ